MKTQITYLLAWCALLYLLCLLGRLLAGVLWLRACCFARSAWRAYCLLSFLNCKKLAWYAWLAPFCLACLRRMLGLMQNDISSILLKFWAWFLKKTAIPVKDLEVERDCWKTTQPVMILKLGWVSPQLHQSLNPAASLPACWLASLACLLVLLACFDLLVCSVFWLGYLLCVALIAWRASLHLLALLGLLFGVPAVIGLRLAGRLLTLLSYIACVLCLLCLLWLASCASLACFDWPAWLALLAFFALLARFTICHGHVTFLLCLLMLLAVLSLFLLG